MQVSLLRGNSAVRKRESCNNEVKQFPKERQKICLHVKQRTVKATVELMWLKRQCLSLHPQNQIASLKGWRHNHKSENFPVKKVSFHPIVTHCCLQYVWKQKHVQIFQSENLSFHSRRELRKMEIK